MQTRTRSFATRSLFFTLATLALLSNCDKRSVAPTGPVTMSSTIDVPPIADAGIGPMARPGEIVVLDGSGSRDPNGDPLQVSWSQIAGEPVSLAGADTLTPQFVAPELAQSSILLFLLEVSDGISTAEDRVAVGVPAAGEALSTASLSGDILCGFSVIIDGEFDRRDGPRPLYVTLEATIIGEDIPEDARLVWSADDTEDSGPVSTHTNAMRVFTAAGVHTIALAMTTGGITMGCRSIYNGQLQETVTVSPIVTGRIQTTDGAGVPAVTVSATSGGTTGVTNSEGLYEINIPIGWSGVVTPQHIDYTFVPTNRALTNVTADKAVDFSIVAGDLPPPGGDGNGDTCPSDPNKTVPGLCGCGVPDIDSDGDGLLDCNEGCPNDPNKSAPGACGCGIPDIDSDGNGVLDCNEGCPDTDSDGDGVLDCNDDCPNDPNKTTPGLCGCGVADTDSDGDGTPDCNDGCANTDTDGDGVVDCNDGCENDPNKTAPGLCGCGVADTDSDGNGTPDCLDPTAATLVLDIPSPTATRMSPCPVFASLDFDASSTGDASTWDQCKITWTLSRVGGLAAWPAKYRYVTDPRPGLNGIQRDLATEGRGFNMGWLLTEGEWTIQCTVTNPSRQVASVTSAPITIAPNTRTKVYVNSATGTDDPSHGTSAIAPYATLGYAFSQHGATDDMEYELAGGHVEDRTTSRLSASGDNAHIRWDGVGNRPKIRWGVDNGGFDTMIAVTAGSEHQVWEGIQVENMSSTLEGAGTSVIAFAVGGDLCAFVDINAIGSFTPAPDLAGNRFDHFIVPGGPGPTGLLMQNCVTGATSGYSLVYTSGRDYFHNVVVGCNLGKSSNESVIRTTAPLHKINILYNSLTQNEIKSTLRLVAGTFHHAYGNKMTDGDIWLGRISKDFQTVTTLRLEANHMSGTTSLGGPIGIGDSLHDATICNNILKPGVFPTGNSQLTLTFGSPTAGPGRGLTNIKLYLNTIILPAGAKQGVFSGSSDGTNLNFSENKLVGNLLIRPGTQERGLFYSLSNVELSFVSGNVMPDFTFDSPFGNPFAFLYVNGTRSFVNNLTDWNALPFVGADIGVDTAVDSVFTPTPSTDVTTPEGTFDDYYGNQRSVTTSWAGAVNAAP
ncbi:MAG: hypothetical protein ACE5E5_10575 [Phycisphaerae bacterium]